MANKNTKIGFDPLAWMKEDQGTAKKPSRPKTAPRDASKKSKPRKTSASKQAHPLGLDVDTLEQSFNALAPRAEVLVSRFYQELFARYPQVRPLFGNTTPDVQQRKLLAALKLVIANLRNPEALAGALTELGKRHQGYGAEPAHYQAVASTLLDVMAELAGDVWTDEIEAAWNKALSVIAETMLKAYNSHEDMRMDRTEPANAGARAVNNEHVRMKAAVDGATTAIMMIDRDFNINYANNATIALLTKHQDTLRTVYPGFDAANLIGQNIDRFHKNPARQRQLLSNPANLPYATDIEVGPLKFRLNVTAIVDADGAYVGNCLEWSDVTELRAREDDVAQLQGAIDNAMTPIMMIDRDHIITYVNTSTVKLLSQYQETLGSLYPGFNAQDMVGQSIDRFHKNPSHQRQLLNNPANLPYSTDIAVGPLKFHLNVTAVVDANGNYIGNCLEWTDVTQQRAKEREIARLQSAIAGSTTSLMLCDENLDITYVNPAVEQLFRNRQAELRKVFPSLDADNLVGQNIDQFHKNPAHQRALLSDMNRLPAKAEISLLDLNFEVNATAIVDQSGVYMGNMVEWKDITEQKDGERQIQALIESAAAGDLDTRIDVTRYAGFMKNLGEGVNSLLDAVVTPVREGTRVVKALAEGDLTESMAGEFQGEFAVLRDAINQSISNLQQMVGEIRTSTGNISSAAAEIAQGNADLSQRTEQQASSLQETASSMEELTSTVRQNADNARQANQLASGAREQAEKGGDVVSQAVNAMAEINDSSKKISDIIGVIDEIAFQTNLLALNAAVEAARAGEQGRGFAVVAGEVRNLAQRSAAAAKEIKSLIKDSVEKVEDGTRLVDASGQTLEEIVNAVKKVSDIIAEIAAASQEQSTGIDQINKTVVQMDEVTQQNAALVEEAAAASESLDEQAKSLERMIDFFSLDDSEPQGGAQVKRGVSTGSKPGVTTRAPVARRREAPPPTRRPAPSKDAGSDDEWEEF